MISNQNIVELVQSQIDGKEVYFQSINDTTQYRVEGDHKWDFTRNHYFIFILGKMISAT